MFDIKHKSTIRFYGNNDASDIIMDNDHNMNYYHFILYYCSKWDNLEFTKLLYFTHPPNKLKTKYFIKLDDEYMLRFLEFVCLLNDCKQHDYLPNLEKFNILLIHFINNNIFFNDVLVQHNSMKYFHHFFWCCITPVRTYKPNEIPQEGMNDIKTNRFKHIKDIINGNITDEKTIKFQSNFQKMFKITIKNLKKLLLINYEHGNQNKNFQKWNRKHQPKFYLACKEIMQLCK